MRTLLLPLALCLALAAPANSHAAHRAHDHAPAPTAKPAPAQRWSTDAALRKGMGDVRLAVAEYGRQFDDPEPSTSDE